MKKLIIILIILCLPHYKSFAQIQKEVNYIFNEAISLPQFIDCLRNNEGLMPNIENYKNMVVSDNGIIPKYVNITKGHYETITFFNEKNRSKSERDFMVSIDYTFTQFKIRKKKAIVKFKYPPHLKLGKGYMRADALFMQVDVIFENDNEGWKVIEYDIQDPNFNTFNKYHEEWSKKYQSCQ